MAIISTLSPEQYGELGIEAGVPTLSQYGEVTIKRFIEANPSSDALWKYTPYNTPSRALVDYKVFVETDDKTYSVRGADLHRVIARLEQMFTEGDVL